MDRFKHAIQQARSSRSRSTDRSSNSPISGAGAPPATERGNDAHHHMSAPAAVLAPHNVPHGVDRSGGRNSNSMMSSYSPMVPGPSTRTRVDDASAVSSSAPVSSTRVNKQLPRPPAPAAVAGGPSNTTNYRSDQMQEPVVVPIRNSSIPKNKEQLFARIQRPAILPSISLSRIRTTGSLRSGSSGDESDHISRVDHDTDTRRLSHMPTVYEDGPSRQEAPVTATHTTQSLPMTPGPEKDQGRLSKALNAVRSVAGIGRNRSASAPAAPPATGPTAIPDNSMQYDPRMVDFLDTIDPEVQTLTSLTNMQNSLFVPNLGKYVNRRPTYSLTSLVRRIKSPEESPATTDTESEDRRVERPQTLERIHTMYSIDSTLDDSRYAVLPHGESLEGWSRADKMELNDHVRHMLHSRRSRFKRSLKGFGQYVKRPLGFLVTLYATLITLFGLAWVLFLIGWINVGGKQLYVINVIDYTLVALFAIVGDGLAPFRAVDTYHMIFIARYHHLTWKLRQKKRLPDLRDHNDLPTTMPPTVRQRYTRKSISFFNRVASRLRRDSHNEKDIEDPYQEYSVLNRKQQERLMHHQEKFSKSHTFYKPHETETHYAFPLRLLVAVVVLLDFHSLFQIALGAVTWGIDYHNRPFVLTTVILCCSITCNATAGLLIWIGDKRTRKKDVLERMNRQELTSEAIEKMEKKWEKEEEQQKDEMKWKSTSW